MFTRRSSKGHGDELERRGAIVGELQAEEVAAVDTDWYQEQSFWRPGSGGGGPSRAVEEEAKADVSDADVASGLLGFVGEVGHNAPAWLQRRAARLAAAVAARSPASEGALHQVGAGAWRVADGRVVSFLACDHQHRVLVVSGEGHSHQDGGVDQRQNRQSPDGGPDDGGKDRIAERPPFRKHSLSHGREEAPVQVAAGGWAAGRGTRA